MQLTEHVHALRVPFKVRPNPNVTLDRFVYCFLIVEDSITLIDAGVAGTESLISSYLKGIGRDVSEIKTLVQTHAHPDHIGSSKAIKAMTACKVLIHEAECTWLEDVEKQLAERPVPGFHELVGGSVKVDTCLADGNLIHIGKGSALKVYHAPGHSPGSVCLEYGKDNVMFTGDVVPLPGDMPIYDDADLAIDSIRRLQGLRFEHMMSAWDDPRSGEEVPKVLLSGLDFMVKIQEAVNEVLLTTPDVDDVVLCKKAFEKVGLGHVPPMPLVLRSIRSNRAAFRARSV